MITRTLTVATMLALLISCNGNGEKTTVSEKPLSEVMLKVQTFENAIKEKDFDYLDIIEPELTEEWLTNSELTIDEKLAIGDAKDKLDEAKVRWMKPFQKKYSAFADAMSIKKNEFDAISWNRDKSSPQYTDVNAFYLYFGTNNDGSTNGLRLRAQFTGDDWLFHDSFKVLADGKTWTLYPNEVERDNGSGMIWEWSDEPLRTYTGGEQLIVAIINSSDAKIRFEGDQYYSVKQITKKQKNALRNVVFAFVANGGYFGRIAAIK